MAQARTSRCGWCGRHRKVFALKEVETGAGKRLLCVLCRQSWLPFEYRLSPQHMVVRQALVEQFLGESEIDLNAEKTKNR